MPSVAIPTQFEAVTAIPKANIYFEGKVVSHSILFADGSKKTLGLIYPGVFHFGTQSAERMEIVAGSCRARIDGQSEWKDYRRDETFEVSSNSGFDIEVKEGICEYICSFL